MTTNVAGRVFNFSAGPAAMPLPVLEQVQRDLLCLPGAGASIMEISHRSQAFKAVMRDAQQRLVDLLNIPENYEILFLQGGSRLQFSMVPMNLLRGQGRPADYLITGSWSAKAFQEAAREGEVREAFSAKATNFNRLPEAGEATFSPDAAYTYITSNETIQGVQFSEDPAFNDAPLICDASSDFLHRPTDVSKYGLLFACAQKNAGPAGLTIVIIRRDLLERSDEGLPGYLNYVEHQKNDSMYNTPPTFAIYVFGLIVKWLQEDIGGLEAMHRINQQKARMLYDEIDASDGFYSGHAEKSSRSLMNVAFRLPSEELTAAFLQKAKDEGLDSLGGHRSVGGVRASIYNAMPMEGVETLRDMMRDFRADHG